jgi:hypothetical protein
VKGTVGMFERKTSPKLKREDSSIKEAMKTVMELGRKNKPPMPKVERRR